MSPSRGWTRVRHRPLDLEPGHPRFRTNIPNQPLKHHILRRTLLHLFIIVLGILIIAYADKLLFIIRTGEDESRDTEYIFSRNTARVRGRTFEFERIRAHGYGSNETGVEFLVELMADIVIGLLLLLTLYLITYMSIAVVEVEQACQ